MSEHRFFLTSCGNTIWNSSILHLRTAYTFVVWPVSLFGSATSRINDRTYNHRWFSYTLAHSFFYKWCFVTYITRLCIDAQRGLDISRVYEGSPSEHTNYIRDHIRCLPSHAKVTHPAGRDDLLNRSWFFKKIASFDITSKLTTLQDTCNVDAKSEDTT